VNNELLSKKVFSQNVIGSFILIMRRQPKPNEPRDRISDMVVAMYHFVIIKQDNRICFLDIADDIDVGYGLYLNLYGGMDNSNKLSEQDFWIYDGDLEGEGKDVKKESIKCKKNTIDIFNNSSKAVMYVNHPLYGKIATYKIKILKGEDFPVYSLECFGKDLKELKLENDCEDVLNIDDRKIRFINWFKRFL
jgi:hypothetical protein